MKGLCGGSNHPRIYTSVGTWFSSKGGNIVFVRWLMEQCDHYLDPGWRELDPDDVWSQLNDIGWSTQTEAILEGCRGNVDVVLQELYGDMCEAQSVLRSADRLRRGPKRAHRAVVSTTKDPALSRCQRRNAAKQLSRQLKRKKAAKAKRRLACCRAFGPSQCRKRGTMVIGTWNTRGLGAPLGKDPVGKFNSLFSVMAERQWNVALLTDSRFKYDGVSQTTVKGRNWLIVHYGKVAVALDEWLASRWRRGGITTTLSRIFGPCA